MVVEEVNGLDFWSMSIFNSVNTNNQRQLLESQNNPEQTVSTSVYRFVLRQTDIHVHTYVHTYILLGLIISSVAEDNKGKGEWVEVLYYTYKSRKDVHKRRHTHYIKGTLEQMSTSGTRLIHLYRVVNTYACRRRLTL